MTYDPTTTQGLVRLLAGDTDPVNQIFTDTEVQALLNFHGGEAGLAAAQALDSIGANQNYIQRRIMVLGLQLDGPAVSAECRQLAASLREQVAQGIAGALPFDIAEQAVDAFAARELLLKLWQRGALP